MRDCEEILLTLLRRGTLDAAEQSHRSTCARCGELAPLSATLLPGTAATAPPPPPGVGERVLAAAAPLLLANARTERAARAVRATPRLDGARLATALLPAMLLFPLLVLVDVALLRAAHELLVTLLPQPLGTYLVLSYAALLGALVCLTFGAIPLLVQRQVPVSWKEGHV